MPLLLEPIEVIDVCAYSPDQERDEAGRFAAGGSVDPKAVTDSLLKERHGLSRSEVLQQMRSSSNPRVSKAAKATLKADKNPTLANLLDAKQKQMAAILDPVHGDMSRLFLIEHQQTPHNDEAYYRNLIHSDNQKYRGVKAYSPDQERDDNGRFAGGGDSSPGVNHAAHAAALQQYKAVRQAAFNSAKNSAKAAIAKADKAADDVGRVSSDKIMSPGESSDKSTDRFSEKWAAMDESANSYDTNASPRDKAENLSETRAAAKAALRANEKVRPGDGSDRISQADIDHNRQHLIAIIAKVSVAIGHLKTGAAFAREARAIKKREAF